MNEHEHKAAAAKLIEAIKNNTNGAYDKWAAVEDGDMDGYARWVQESIGLPETPSHDDLQAMHEHSRAHLQDKVADMRAAHPEGPVCGLACVADESNPT